jgi:hypothetical protein
MPSGFPIQDRELAAANLRESKRKYRMKTREKANEYRKKYYEAHRDAKVECECGSITVPSYANKHRTTKKHLEYIAALETVETS